METSSPPSAEAPSAIVADDNDSIAKILGMLVERMGYELRRARTGEEALAMAQERPPTFMLLDVMLPGMDGYTVLTRLRGTDWGRDLPVLVVTGEDGAVQDEISAALGCGRVIRKPFDLEDVAERVEGMLPVVAGNASGSADA